MNPKKFRGWCTNGCGNALRKGVKYCSPACAGRSKKKPVAPQYPCANGCGKLAGPSRSYCSCQCASAHRSKLSTADFIGRGGTYGRVSPHLLARCLRRHFGERCSRCGWSERHPKTGNVPVEVEHVDGDWQNNRLTNLTLLCPNCHALTPTFRGLNRGHGRPYRLGGRDNPLALHAQRPLDTPRPVRPKQVPYKVLEEPSPQLQLWMPT